MLYLLLDFKSNHLIWLGLLGESFRRENSTDSNDGDISPNIVTVCFPARSTTYLRPVQPFIFPLQQGS
jgi:hypothetical protein